MVVDETYTDTRVSIICVLTFKESDLVGYVSHSRSSDLRSEIPYRNSAAMMRQQIKYR